MSAFKIEKFPASRIATRDVCSVGQQKHHIAALIEIDVNESRKKIKQHKSQKHSVSFTAWLIKAIGCTIAEHKHVAAYLKGKRKLLIFDDINVSITVEKDLNGQKIPIPLIIEKADEQSIEAITKQLKLAREQNLTQNDIVLHKKTKLPERIYYRLPGFTRRYFWRYLTKHPHYAFRKMGNVALTSVGMIGTANGWFVPISVHPVCFGIGKVNKKPIIVNDKIEIREMLNLSVLLDHDVVDGAQMARFISKLSANIEKGIGL